MRMLANFFIGLVAGAIFITSLILILFWRQIILDEPATPFCCFANLFEAGAWVLGFSLLVYMIGGLIIITHDIGKGIIEAVKGNDE